MAVAPSTPKLSPYRFSVEQYEALLDRGILAREDRVELLDGVVWSKRPPHEPFRFAVERYEAMVDAGILTEDDRTELIEGEIVAKMTIGDRHAACVDRLNRLFNRRLDDDQAIVRVQNPVRVTAGIPEPDLALLRPRADFYAGGKPTPADIFLLIEVADSSLAIDREVKAPLYARAGVAEYWIANLVDEVVEVHRDPRPDGTYAAVAVIPRGGAVGPLAFPELVLPVDQILIA
jgi:Uma2 family endonuclease